MSTENVTKPTGLAGQEHSPKISMIIPVYNTVPYLRHCLNSVINQTLQDIQIICINDGSTDGSLAVLEEYAARDSRIEIVNQENQGVGTTRNNAIPYIKGEYVYYVDSDDWLELDLCEKAWSRIQETGADAVYLRSYNNLDENRVAGMNRFDANLPEIRTLPEHYTDLVFHFPALWSKLIKTELFTSGAVYSDPGIYEETLSNWRIILNAESIAVLDEPLYHYRIARADSILNTKGAQHFVMLDRYATLKQLLIESGKYDTYRDLYCRVKLFHCRRVYERRLQDEELKAEFERQLWNSMGEDELAFYRDQSNLHPRQFLYFSRLEHTATYTPKNMAAMPCLPESKTVIVLGTQRSLSSITMKLLEAHGATTSIPSNTDPTGFVRPVDRELASIFRLDRTFHSLIYKLFEYGWNYRDTSHRVATAFREGRNILEEYPADLMKTGTGLLVNCKRFPLTALKHPGMLLCWDFWEKAMANAKALAPKSQTHYILAMCVRNPYEVALSYIVRSCRGFSHMSDIYGLLDTYYKVQLSIIEKYRDLEGFTVLPVRANGGYYRTDIERLVLAMGKPFKKKVFAELFSASPTLDMGKMESDGVFETYQRLMEECERLISENVPRNSNS